MAETEQAADEYQQAIANALMQAIFDASMVEIDGEPTAYLRSIEVAGALVTVLSTILEGSPSCRTARGMRDTAESIAKGMHKLMRETRRLREEGRAPFNPELIYTN